MNDKTTVDEIVEAALKKAGYIGLKDDHGCFCLIDNGLFIRGVGDHYPCTGLWPCTPIKDERKEDKP